MFEAAIEPCIRLAMRLEHQDCPKEQEWREKNDREVSARDKASPWSHAPSANPPFKPVSHAQDRPEKLYLQCEACGTAISHSVSFPTAWEVGV